MVGAQRFVTLLQVRHAFFALNEAQVRNRRDERTGGAERAFARQVGPELPGDLELGVDVNRFFGVDRAISRFRRVVQLAQPGVAGACVVPGVGALCRTGIHQLDDFNLEVRVQLFEQYGEGGTHDARPDQHYVDCFVMRH